MVRVLRCAGKAWRKTDSGELMMRQRGPAAGAAAGPSSGEAPAAPTGAAVEGITAEQQVRAARKDLLWGTAPQGSCWLLGLPPHSNRNGAGQERRLGRLR